MITPNLSECTQAAYAVYGSFIPHSIYQYKKVVIGNDLIRWYKSHYGKLNIIAFCGSDDRFDWFNNLAVCKEDFNGVKIHRGFLRSSLNLVEEVKSWLRQIGSDEVCLVGHSRGGGLAQTVNFLIYDGSTSIPTITYGSPKVFGSDFRYDLNITRFEMRNDIVAKVPKIGYSHIGKCYYFDGKAWTENPKFKDRWLDFGFSAHSMKKYYEAIDL